MRETKTTRPRTAFDRPQWTLAPDPRGKQQYANVDNRLEMNIGGEVYYLAIAVPTELFTFLREVIKADSYLPVTLAIDSAGERYMLSVMVGDDLYDLWTYSDSSIPKWMIDRNYAMRDA